MTLKKLTASKRTNLPRSSDYTKSFNKDWHRLSQSGRYDMNKLKEAIILIIKNDGPLGAEWADHSLKGEWQGQIFLFMLDLNKCIIYICVKC